MNINMYIYIFTTGVTYLSTIKNIQMNDNERRDGDPITSTTRIKVENSLDQWDDPYKANLQRTCQKE